MRRIILFVLAFAVVPASVAVAESDGLKVTGGGQVIAGGSAGPGDTIAFTAQQVGTEESPDGGFPARGELQVQNRQAGNGQLKQRFHGVVTCITEVIDDDGNRFVRFGGYQKVRGQTTAQAFTVDTADNGEGSGASGSDMIYFRQRDPGDQPCEEDTNPATELRTSELSRGNVQEH